MSEFSSYPIVLQPIEFIKASEEVDWHDVQNLAQQIAQCGQWTMPMPIEGQTGIVMDGNHRLRAARLLGLSHVPCILLSYSHPGVTVQHWVNHTRFAPEEIHQKILKEGKIFPYKTTRHTFEPALPRCEISIISLRRAFVEQTELVAA